MPSPKITSELRQAWRETKDQAIMDTFSNFGLNAIVKDSRSRHIQILGGVRPVNLYASTGTVNAPPHDNFKSTVAMEMMPERALKRAVSIAKFGH